MFTKKAAGAPAKKSAAHVSKGKAPKPTPGQIQKPGYSGC